MLYLVNRPGNVVSHEGAAEWIDKAIGVVWPYARTITLRGDTDFYLTEHLDRWAEIVDFVFGADANPALVRRAEGLEEARYKPLKRKSKYTVKTEERERPENVKEKIVEQREFENLRLESEEVAEFRYRPVKCKREYRVVVVRKNISHEKGEAVLLPAQIIRQGRKIIYRLLGYNAWLKDFFSAWEFIRRAKFA